MSWRTTGEESRGTTGDGSRGTTGEGFKNRKPTSRAIIPRTECKTKKVDLGKEGTGGSGQAGCKEMCPRVKKGVSGETETGRE